MNAKQLMDSRRFCLLMDDLAATWSKKRASDEDKEFRLQAVLDALGMVPAAVPAPVQMAPAPSGPPAPPPPSKDDLYAACIEYAKAQPAGPDGVRWGLLSLDAGPEGLGDYIERVKPGLAVSENHPIGLSGGAGMREAWSIPFVG